MSSPAISIDAEAKQEFDFVENKANDQVIINATDYEIATHETLKIQQASITALLKHRRALAVLFSIMFAATIVGSEGTLTGALLGMQSFCRVMGNGYMSGGKYVMNPKILTIWNAAAAPMQVVGQFISGFTADYFGRRYNLYGILVLAWIGIVVAVTSTTWQQFMGAKIILAITGGLYQSAATNYVGELAPREIRGICMTFLLMVQQIGSLTMTLITYGTNVHYLDPNSTLGWKIPLYVGLGIPALAFAYGLFYMVESPYWLLMRNRPDAARKSLQFIHVRSSEQEIDLLLAECKYTLEKEASVRELQKQSSMIDCFRGVNLRRTFCAFFPAMTQSLSGNTLVGPYAVYFFTLAGQTNSLQSSSIALAVAFLANILTCFLIDNRRIGRWKLLVAGLCMMIVSMMGIGITATALHEPWGGTSGKLFLVFIIIGTIGAHVGPGAAGGTYMVESGSAVLRAKTNTLGQLGNGITGTIYNVSIAYMLSDSVGMGMKTGYWFGGCGVVSLVLVCFFIPDYTGRSFAQIDELFSKKVPARQFKGFECTGDYGRTLAEIQQDL